MEIIAATGAVDPANTRRIILRADTPWQDYERLAKFIEDVASVEGVTNYSMDGATLQLYGWFIDFTSTYEGIMEVLDECGSIDVMPSALTDARDLSRRAEMAATGRIIVAENCDL